MSRHHRHGRLVEDGFQPAAFRPELGPDRDADNGDLEQALEQIDPAFEAEQALEARPAGESLAKSGTILSGEKIGARLQHMAGQMPRQHHGKDGRQRQWRSGATERRASCAESPAPSTLICVGLFQEDGEEPRQMPMAVDLPNMAMASVPPPSRTKVVTSGGFDDVAGFARLFEPFLCRLFCLLGFVADRLPSA